MNRRQALAAIVGSVPFVTSLRDQLLTVSSSNGHAAPSPVPNEQWEDWNDVADSLARMEWEGRERQGRVPHSISDIDWDRKGVRIRLGTGTVEDVDVDLQAALAGAGNRALGQAVVRRGQAWAIVVWEGGGEC